MLASLQAAGKSGTWAGELRRRLGTGLAQLTGGDVIRPGLPWLLTTTSPARVAAEMGRVRDPAGITVLKALREAAGTGHATFDPAVERIGLIMAAKGGLLAGITPGDCIELLDCALTVFTGKPRTSNRHSPFFYQLLHTAGAFPPSAPATVRMISTKFAGPLTPEQMTARYDIACQPVRDLLAGYLRERRPGTDYSSLNQLAGTLGLRLWKDLETRHPGISSLHLPPDVAAAWKQRIQARTVRTPDGGEQLISRQSADDNLMTVRGFSLGLARRALDDPARWGPWAVPCPVRGSDIQYKKQKSRTKARMDARTRERLPVLPALAAAAGRNRTDAAARLAAARAAAPGETFTAGGQQLRRACLAHPSPRTWAEEPASGERRDLTREEDHASWAWAVIEVLRHTGIRVEELTELSHHSLVQYRLPGHRRARPPAGHRPVQDRRRTAPRHQPRTRRRPVRDHHPHPPPRRDRPAPRRLRHPRAHLEPAHAPAAPAARRPGGPAHRHRQHPRPPHQRAHHGRNHRHRRQAPHLQAPRLPQDLHHRRHPQRHAAPHRPAHPRPPRHQHHHGPEAVYPVEAINGHRAFISRRRQLRPGEEYRTPTDTEWEEFLGHFEHRRVALGDCGRAYGTSCVHEHSCLSDARSSASTPPSGTASKRSAPTSTPASPKPNAKDGSAKPKNSRSASTPPPASSPRPTRPPPAAPRPSTSASPPT
jgi:hypothetical protein